MKLLDKLERKYKKYAIHNLMLYIVFANAAVFLLNLLSRNELSYQLMLIPSQVYQGEIWRLFTFLMIPPTNSFIWIIFVLMFYYRIGLTLEHEWGSFKFNVYYFLGVIIMIVTSMVFGIVGMPIYLNTTLFLAFATLYPNYEIRLYMILPIKVKYLAYFTAGSYLFMFLLGGLGTKISILAGVSNYLIFFGKDLVLGRKQRIQSASRKKTYVKESAPVKAYLHKCAVCNRTDKDDKTLEFRYCSKCEGHIEYCIEHLQNHEHIT